MDRKSFLSNIFKAAVAIAIMEHGKLLMPAVDQYMVSADALPGIEPTLFKIKLMKGWFWNGDIVSINGKGNKFYYSEAQQMFLVLYCIIVVELTENKQYESEVRRLCNAWIEYDQYLMKNHTLEIEGLANVPRGTLKPLL